MTTSTQEVILPLNPFKGARESIIDPDTGRSISHARLAKRIGVTKLSLIRLEQGTFNDPLPRVLDYFCNRGFNYLSLTDGYINYQHQMRVAHAYYFGLYLDAKPDEPVHPFAQLRGERNLTEVSKSLCLPQSTLSRFESDYRSQQSVPKVLINVLPVLGYPDEQISEFIQTYKDWRLRALGKNVVKFDDYVKEM